MCKSRISEKQVIAILREIVAERRRFGNRRIGVLLARRGTIMNKNKLYRFSARKASP